MEILIEIIETLAFVLITAIIIALVVARLTLGPQPKRTIRWILPLTDETGEVVAHKTFEWKGRDDE